MAFNSRMLPLEGCDQLRQDKELIATDKNDELRLTGISVDIGDIVDIVYMEDIALVSCRIICSLAPRGRRLCKAGTGSGEEHAECKNGMGTIHLD
jgi:hypothetical protein